MFIRRNRISGTENGSCDGARGVDRGRRGQRSPLVKQCGVFRKRSGLPYGKR
jgi:hypothetical protein